MNIDQLIPPVPLDEESRLAIGTDVEKEHFRGGKNVDKTPRAVAQTHLGENPRYYPKKRKPKGALEVLRWMKQEHCGHCPEDEPGDVTEAECPMCGGPGVLLGKLGSRVHFRCRNCGMDFSQGPRPE